MHTSTFKAFSNRSVVLAETEGEPFRSLRCLTLKHLFAASSVKDNRVQVDTCKATLHCGTHCDSSTNLFVCITHFSPSKCQRLHVTGLKRERNHAAMQGLT